ncbi:MAG: glycosyltransferase family 4 protein [Bacteroidetes bacterium]|nr:glycosyltransferase family 4 protein [Bacteroidota bacterium]
MKTLKSKIVAVHLLNDFSGSPLVFSQALNALKASGHPIVIHTSQGKSGFLDQVEAPKYYFPYQFYSNTLLRLLAFSFSQVFLFFQLMKYRKEDVIIYVNTLLPFGAALAAFCMKKQTIYHVHESYIKPAALKYFLRWVASFTADTIFYVSNYLYQKEKIGDVNACVLHNVLPENFVDRAAKKQYVPSNNGLFTVLMVCSFKEYKGVPQFIELAIRHPSLNFELVLNTSREEVNLNFSPQLIPSNLKVFSVQKDLDAFYSRANLVVNLTNPKLCIETFGMTLLEAMSYGVPVIAPTQGGPTELVEETKNGFQIDVQDEATLDFRLTFLASNPEFMQQLSKGARETAKRFGSDKFRNTLVNVFDSCNKDVRN